MAETSDGETISNDEVNQRTNYYWQRHPVFASSGTPMVVNIEPPDPTNILLHPALKPLFNRLNRVVEPSPPEKTRPTGQTVFPLQAQSVVDAMKSIQ